MTELTAAQLKREKTYKEATESLLLFNGVKEMPKMGNWTPARLVDMVGEMKEIEKDAKKTINMLNSVIDSKITPEELEGKKAISGEKYSMKISPVSQYRLDTDLARAKITELAKKLYKDNPECDKLVADELDYCHKTIDMSQHRYDEL